MKNRMIDFYRKVIVSEEGDLVQNIMWLAFIALACIAAIGLLGKKLGDAAGNAAGKIDGAINPGGAGGDGE